jgi:hypothetical protein
MEPDPAGHTPKRSGRGRFRPTLTWLGLAFVVVGIAASIVFAVRATNCDRSFIAGAPSVASCNPQHDLAGAGFFILVVGATLMVVGTFVLPILRERNDRRHHLP